jgi:hypothetical protein
MTTKVASFVPEIRTFHTDDPEDLSIDLNQMYRDLSQGINQRAIGFTAPTPSLNGKRYFGITSRVMMGYTAVLQANSILNGVTTIPHGIPDAFLATMRLVSLTGGASSAPSSFLPLPYVNVTTPANGIQMSILGPNVEIATTTADYVGYSALIVVEFAVS